MIAIRLLIVDDHPIMRDGLRGVFSDDPGSEVVGEAGDGAEAARLAQRVAPDVILMELRMPAMGGVEATTRLPELGHPARVLILTTYDPTGTCCPPSRPAPPGTCSRTSP